MRSASFVFNVLSKTCESFLTYNTDTAAESRHVHSLRLSRPLAHTHTPYLSASRLIRTPETTILTPCPMLRCLSAKSIALVLIALNDLEETARGQGGGARRFVDVTKSFAYPPEAGGVARAMACRARACEGPRGRERQRARL